MGQDRLLPAARDASGTQTESKPSQRRQHIAASQTMLTANTHAAHCYLYHMPCIKDMLHLRRASPRHRDGDRGRRGRRRAGLLPRLGCPMQEFWPLQGFCPMQGILSDAGNLPDAGNSG